MRESLRSSLVAKLIVLAFVVFETQAHAEEPSSKNSESFKKLFEKMQRDLTQPFGKTKSEPESRVYDHTIDLCKINKDLPQCFLLAPRPGQT
jgi:hypothetical protein